MQSNIFKRFFVLILIFLIPISNAFARGGGGGSGGGGSGSGSSGGGSLLQPAVALMVFITITIVGVYNRNKKLKQTKSLLEKAVSSDPAWGEAGIKQIASDTFNKFQKDWSDFNCDGMKSYLTESFYQRVSLELNVLKNQKRQNLMSDVYLGSVVVWNLKDNEGVNSDSVTLEMSASAKDQLVDLECNKVLYTDSEPFIEYWTFVRVNSGWKLNLIEQATEDRAMREDSIADFAERNKFFYDADFGWLMMPLNGVVFRKGNLTVSDINNHVIGSFKDKIVEFYTFIPNPQSFSKKNYIVAQAILPIKYKDILVRRKRMLFNLSPRGLRRVRTESNDFDRKFCLWAHPQDQINSFELLTPDFMVKIYDLPFELNIEIVDNILYFYAESRKDIDYDVMLDLLGRAFDDMER
ncbi:MAG: DUF3137 domain-containing protein [Candidatus Nomurabacteria bacterium]|nr:DUF3137 domain-containing protein [Candidatus Nomurabacteria bacterium]